MQTHLSKIIWSAVLFFDIALLHSGQHQAVHAQESAAGIWDGIYTEQQVARGQSVYQEACASCHKEDLTGQDMTPSLVGIGFSFKWQGKNLQELYASMRYGMPQDAPGSLSDQAYADLTALLLSHNGYPPGESELGADEDRLALIEITSQR
ncbi:MAG: cytochrome c [Gammaproteobacteria bacterium]|nr:cytochrome c [Gammaproteobacteria bacterium]MDP6651086.1 cytochrome c [Gammaproteobacteria bacterium]